MLHWILLLYFLLGITGISLLTGKLVSLVLPRQPDVMYRLLAGFSLFPVLAAWAGFSGIGKIPWLSESLTGIAVVYVLLSLPAGIRKLQTTNLKQSVALLFLPASLILVLFVSKACYLEGAYNNLDDLRSITLTGSIASNALKPAFPLDYSAPLSYSYYLYQWMGFLYDSVTGIDMPTVPLLAINLFVIGLFYSGLYQAARFVIAGFRPAHFLLLSAIVTFYGFDFLHDKVWQIQHIEWWNTRQLTQMASYFHWTYQYLFSAILLLLAVLHLRRYLQDFDKQDAWLFILFHASAAGFGAITFVWSTLAIMIMLLLISPAIAWRKLSGSLISLLVPLTLLSLFILLPVLPAFIGREVIVSFNLQPALWFPSTETGIMAILDNIKILFIETGPFVFTGLLISILFLLKTANRNKLQLKALSFYAIGLLLIATFSHSSYFDWFSRGILLSVLVAGLFALDFFSPLLIRKTANPKMLTLLLLLLLAPQVYNFMLENYFRQQKCQVSDQTLVARKLNATFPLGSIFETTDKAYETPVLLSGRGLFNKQSRYLTTYKNRPEFLAEKFRWQADSPICSQSLYGTTLPENRTYLQIQNNQVIQRHCKQSGPVSP